MQPLAKVSVEFPGAGHAPALVHGSKNWIWWFGLLVRL